MTDWSPENPTPEDIQLRAVEAIEEANRLVRESVEKRAEAPPSLSADDSLGAYKPPSGQELLERAVTCWGRIERAMPKAPEPIKAITFQMIFGAEWGPDGN